MMEQIIDKRGIITSKIDGLEYFEFNEFKPCVSGIYAVLFDEASTAYKCVEQRILMPLFYYDNDTEKWYESTNKISDMSASIIGWRDMTPDSVYFPEK